MTAEQLRDLHIAQHKAAVDYENACQARNKAIRQAVREKWSYGQIAKALEGIPGVKGMSRERVGQIAKP